MTDMQRSVIVLFAHPDDEIGVFPWLTKLQARADRVICVWLTDGGWGGQPVHVRRCESQDVLSALGIAHEDMLFLGEACGVADGALHNHLEMMIARLTEQLGQQAQGGEIWCPAWEGGHPDHDAAHLAGIQLARHAGATAYQFSLYQGRGLPGPWFRVLAPLPENGPLRKTEVGVHERIRCVLRCFRYRSQWKSFLGLLPFYALKMFSRHPFVLQSIDPARTAQRPHEGALLYERRGGPSWEEFAARTGAFRARG